MFNRALAIGITLIALLTALLTLLLVRITDEDRNDYRALLERASPTAITGPLLTQERIGVSKEIHAGSHTLKTGCASSSLSISKEGTFEEMEGLDGELDRAYKFQAERGRYNYRTHRFTAWDGSLQGDDLSAQASRMELYLQQWPDQTPRPLLDTVDPDADLISLHEGASLRRSQYHLEGDTIWIAQKEGELDVALAVGPTTITSSGGEELDADGHLLLDTKSQTLIAEGRPVRYTEQRGWFTTDRLRLAYELDADRALPTELHLQGNVQIAATGDDLLLRHAVADEAHYLPQTDLLTLKASEGSRVLFLDEDSDTRMSAKEIIAQTKEKRAEAIGGVRCYFQEDELKPLIANPSPEGIDSRPSSSADPSSSGFKNPASSRDALDDHPLPRPLDDGSQSGVKRLARE